jgi:hypothetical protein
MREDETMPTSKEDLTEAKRLLAELMAESGIRHISYYAINPSGQTTQPAVSEVHCVLRNIIDFGWDVCELTRTEIPPVIDKDSDELWESVLQSVISCWFTKLDPALPKHRAILRVLSHRYKDIIGKNALDTAQLVHRLRELVSDAEWQRAMLVDD